MTTDDRRIGTELAGCRIESIIGRGGMGVVYLAEQLRYGRKVAIKVLAPELSMDESFRERFEREWQTAARLEHPNIVPVYEAGEAEGVLYIAMRYVEGVDLNALLVREGRLAPARALAILGQAGIALDAAHAQGLVHRDVKPGNILLAAMPGLDEEHVYLTDFGVAKQAQTRSGLTRTGFFVGTIDYAAPEQIEGKPLDGRADVYALGCVLYQCLTGSLPYEKDSEVAMLYAHLMEPPPSLAAKRPDLAPALDPVIAKALAKAPGDRYATCRELVSAARTALSGTAPAGAAPPTEAGAVRTVVGTPATTLAGASPTETGPATPPGGTPTLPPGPPATLPPGPPPTSGWRSRRGKITIAVVGLAAVLGIGLGVGLGMGGGGGGDATEALTATTAGGGGLLTESGTTEGTTTVAPTTETGAVTTTPPTVTTSATDTGIVTETGAVTDTGTTDTVSTDTTGGFPSADEARLLSYLPDKVSGTCVRHESPPEGVTAGVLCDVKGPVDAWYWLFKSKAAMLRYYNQWVSNANASRGVGNCGADSIAEGAYSQGDRSTGRYLCWEDADGDPIITWTHNRLFVGSIAQRTDGNAKRLEKWWESAGPFD